MTRERASVAKVVAKAKAKARRQTEAEAKADADVVVVERQDTAPKPGVSAKEMVNVIADTVERVWEEWGSTRHPDIRQHVRLNAENTAQVITGSLMAGIGKHGPAVRIKEAEAKPRYCKEHK